MIRRNRNYCRTLPRGVADGDVFVGCNFAQQEPGTPIFEGVKGLQFERCNLARAVVPDDAVVERCNTSQEPLPVEVEPEPEVMVRADELESLLGKATLTEKERSDWQAKIDRVKPALDPKPIIDADVRRG